MTKPKVSVILSAFNREKYLGEAIDSILAQEFRDFELILVDDASTDNSAEIIKVYEKRDSRIRALFLDCNTGVSGARNRGFVIAEGEYIAYMDSDDVSLPTRLKKQVDFLEQNPEVGAVGVWVRRMNHDLTIQENIRKCPAEHALIVFNTFNGRTLQILSGTMMIRREYLAAIGGWDEAVKFNVARGFFASLVFRTPIRLANLTEILYIQRVHDQNVTSQTIAQENRIAMVEPRRQLRRLWGGVCDETLRRFRTLRSNERLNWHDRRLAKRDMKRIIETLVTRGYIRPEERPSLLANMNRQLERASPRRWQQFCHWRRHRLRWLTK